MDQAKPPQSSHGARPRHGNMVKFAIPAVLLVVLAAFLVLRRGEQSDSIPGVNSQSWPREFIRNGARLILYQPQIDTWEDYRRLTGRIAAKLTLPQSSEPALGAVRFRADTQADLQERTVYVFNLEVDAIRFPALSEDEGSRLAARLNDMLPTEPVTLSLEQVTAYLDTGRSTNEVRVSQQVPPIFVSYEPAILVMVDGEPLLVDIDETGLQFVLNTNWDLFHSKDASQFYMLNGAVWLEADALDGVWRVVQRLPEEFSKLPDEENWVEVRKHIPARPGRSGSAPLVFYSQEPAELILIDGQPKLEQIPGTELSFVTNTDRDIFFDPRYRSYYFLTSGRWFRAVDFKPPWTLANLELPGDFANIPPDHPKGYVLASVPGTPAAEEAVLMASIPETATIRRDEVTAEASYAGEPDFVNIGGTAMSYAVNTPNDVIRVEGGYYMCYQGIWFFAGGPQGPWRVAGTVPRTIYSIPPESPKHHVTYVHVYNSTPTTVTCGHTSGYKGKYIAMGAVMFGLGYAIGHSNNYWYGPYRYPIYYPPRYYTYGVAARYNPHTGVYHRGAAVYGPYGGYGYAAAYNPRTGTYARSAAAYGPYGGYRVTTAHNPWSGAVARGGTVYGPDGAVRGGHVYNPRTGTYTRAGAVYDAHDDRYQAGYRGGNSYSQWGGRVVVEDDEWARSAYRRDSRGTVAGVETSEGAKAVGVSSDRRQGFVAKGEDNDIYAGKDGNVYRRDETGNWYHGSGGSWQEIDRSQIDAAKTQRRSETEQRAQSRVSPETAAPATSRRQASPSQTTAGRVSSQPRAQGPITATQTPSGTTTSPGRPTPQRETAARQPAGTTAKRPQVSNGQPQASSQPSRGGQEATRRTGQPTMPASAAGRMQGYSSGSWSAPSQARQSLETDARARSYGNRAPQRSISQPSTSGTRSGSSSRSRRRN